MSAKELLDHPYFGENPRPKATAMFPTFPSKAGQEKRRLRASPSAPVRGKAPVLQGDIDLGTISGGRGEDDEGGGGGGWQLKVG
jgi:cell division cycle 2-like protein